MNGDSIDNSRYCCQLEIDFMIKMMRLVLISMVAWLMISCGEKEAEPSIKGHWYYCDENLGYTEIIISDSGLYLLSQETFGMTPVIIEQISNKAIQVDGIGTIELTSPNEAVSIFEDETRKLHRLENDVQGLDDYSCDFNLSYFAFRGIRYNEFAMRSINYGNKCATTLRSDLRPVTLGTLDLLEKEFGSITNPIRGFKSEFQILNDTIESKPKLQSIEFSNDSTKALLTLDVWENTMSDFSVDVHQDSAKVIQINSFYHNEVCKKFNTIRLSILIEFEPKPNFKAIGYNGEILQ